ncbi:MAG TPA: histidinol-phosphate transaminase [Solirubrobacteraceae bacterium]|nr:histidinol-phosphate transaminase [Solirubrobacteraceae bacterium]
MTRPTVAPATTRPTVAPAARPGAGCTEAAANQVAQLDRNEALRGPPPGALARVRRAIASGHLYPHDSTQRATLAAAAHLGVDPARLILTAGVDEASDLCILELGDPFTITPGFDGYGDRAAALNHRARDFALSEQHALPRSLLGAVGPGRLVMLASPNNPTANVFAPQSLRALLWRGAHLMLDETYADFCAHAPGLALLAEYPNLLVFRSFSKAFGLAGLRIGSLVGEPRLIARLRARQAYLTVNGLAAEALMGALQSDPRFPRRHAREVVALREQLIARLRAVGVFVRVHPSATNFVFVTCASPRRAASIRRELIDRFGVIVASAAPLGAPAGLRIGVGLPADAERLIRGLHAIADEDPPQRAIAEEDPRQGAIVAGATQMTSKTHANHFTK